MTPKPSRETVPDRVLSLAVRAQQDTDRGQPAGPLSDASQTDRQLLAVLYALYRHRAVIDWSLSQVCDLRRTHPRVLQGLRVALCQHLYQQGIAKQLAADACVRYVKRVRNRTEANFVNAVLRRLFSRQPGEIIAQANCEGPPYVQLELSPQLYRQWSMHIDSTTLSRLSGILLRPAPIMVRRTLGEEAPSPTVPPGCTAVSAPPWFGHVQLYRCDTPAVFFRSEALSSGTWHIQDPSTFLAPALLAPRPGERIADLCCAPGGKAILLSEMVSASTRILCSDRSASRLAHLMPGAERNNLLCCVADATTPPFPRQLFDAVLVDVPCTNTGVIRRRPDVRWTFSRKKMQELVDIQFRILQSAAACIRPGGRLVYSTCSIEPEENEEQVRRFLEANSCFVLAQEQQLVPEETHDGAYAALLHRQTR